jgi:hypothetical protein
MFPPSIVVNLMRKPIYLTKYQHVYPSVDIMHIIIPHILITVNRLI